MIPSQILFQLFTTGVLLLRDGAIHNYQGSFSYYLFLLSDGVTFISLWKIIYQKIWLTHLRWLDWTLMLEMMTNVWLRSDFCVTRIQWKENFIWICRQKRKNVPTVWRILGARIILRWFKLTNWIIINNLYPYPYILKTYWLLFVKKEFEIVTSTYFHLCLKKYRRGLLRGG